jgi:HSP20 family molecular chaperone IbpA
VDAAKVTAVHEGGIMAVRLPKAEPRAKTRVPVR